jgi:hypothetical protein
MICGTKSKKNKTATGTIFIDGQPTDSIILIVHFIR